MSRRVDIIAAAAVLDGFASAVLLAICLLTARWWLGVVNLGSAVACGRVALRRLRRRW